MWYTCKNKETKKFLISEIEKFIDLVKQSAKALNQHIFIYPLEKSDFRWILINPVNCTIGITGVTVHKDSPIFGCIIINTRRCTYYEAEGFTLDDMIKDGHITMVPAKDIVSKLL